MKVINFDMIMYQYIVSVMCWFRLKKILSIWSRVFFLGGDPLPRKLCLCTQTDRQTSSQYSAALLLGRSKNANLILATPVLIIILMDQVPGMLLGPWSPSCGNVMRVPCFQPFLTVMVRILSRTLDVKPSSFITCVRQCNAALENVDSYL